jgi:uncharacterized protein YndB with AHSA1/START domain
MSERIVMERTYRATLEEVWALWTTKEGIESWWGPEGFSVAVHHLDLRVGGALQYTMTATAPEQVAFMQGAGMPPATESTITYTEVEPQQRLGYELTADFIPGVRPYPVAITVSFDLVPDGVRMTLAFDAMHDEEWTQRAVMGHQEELNRLARVLTAAPGAETR